MSVRTWIQKLTRDIAEERVTTPLRELKAASEAKPEWQPRAVAAFLAVLLIAGAGIAHLRETSAQKTRDFEATWTVPESVKDHAPEPTLPSEKRASPADAVVTDAQKAGGVKDAVHGRSSSLTVSEAASVDDFCRRLSGQARGIVLLRSGCIAINCRTLPLPGGPSRRPQDRMSTTCIKRRLSRHSRVKGRSTRFYVKLLPDSGRLQRDYFYVAIAQPGSGHTSKNVTRVQIWLPTPRDQLQARR